MTSAIRILLGAVIGGVLAGGGLLLGGVASSSSTAGPVTTTATTLPMVRSQPAEPAWVEDGGVRYESTVVVVDALDGVDGAIVLDYRLISLGESGLVLGGGTQLPGVLPETWELVTTSGEMVGATSDPPGRVGGIDTASPPRGVEDSIRFEADQALSRDEVAAVSVSSWRMAVPLDVVVSMPGQKGAHVELHDGTIITLDTILEQRTGALLNFDLDYPPDQWRTAADQGFGLSTQFVGAGPGWKRAASTIGGLGLTGGATGFQLLWQDSTPPDTVQIRVRSVDWQPIPGDLLVWPAP
jgi:hypothetical protein